MSEHYEFRLQSGNRVRFHPLRQELLLHASDGSSKALAMGYAESRLLGLLLAEPGVIRSRDEILKYAWEDRVVAPGNLTQAIFALRNLIEDGRDHEIVQTVPRRGYRFNAEYLVTDGAGEPKDDMPPPGSAYAATNAASSAGAASVAPAATVHDAMPGNGALALAGRFAAWTVFYVALASLLGWIVYHRAEVASSLSRDVHVETWRRDGIAWHFVDIDRAGAEGIRNELAAAIDTMPSSVRGSIWVNRMFRMYDFSCIRTDESATEMVLSETAVRQGKLPALLVSCLEKTP